VRRFFNRPEPARAALLHRINGAANSTTLVIRSVPVLGWLIKVLATVRLAAPVWLCILVALIAVIRPWLG